MKLKILSLTFLIFLLFQILLTSVVYANGVWFYYGDPGLMSIIFILLYFFNSGLEYAIILQFILNFAIHRKKFAGTIFKINLVTYPITQAIIYIRSLFFSSYTILDEYVVLIEVIVIIVEYFLIIRVLKKITVNDQLKNQLNSRRILLSVIIANVTTFLLGLWIQLPFYLLDLNIIAQIRIL